MKNLILVRHADAQSSGGANGDIGRKLTAIGHRNSQLMAEKLSSLDIKPDILVSSPAVRAFETAQEFASVLSINMEQIKLEQAIYNMFDPEEFLQILENYDNDVKTIMIFGHNPSMSEFGSYLCRQFRESMDKTAVLGLKLDCNNWNDIKAGQADLMFYKMP